MAAAASRLDALDWPLRTERLVLRRQRMEDADAVWPWYRLPEVQQWTTALSADLDALRERWEQTLEHGIVGLIGDEIVATGVIRIQDAWAQTDVADRAKGTQAELGWIISPQYQGRGIGTEFAAELLRIAIEELGLRRVEAACFAANTASWRIMQRIGMRQEGLFTEDSLHRSGRWMDGMSWAILASEYRAQHP